MSEHQAIHPNTLSLIEKTIDDQGLPADFKQTVWNYYWPLAKSLAPRIEQHNTESGAAFIGVQGSQGSGKSTCASFLKLLLEAELGWHVLVMSIDDFYLTKTERTELAERQHSLLQTRGVPGTHDVQMIHDAFDHAINNTTPFNVPTFNKALDDRAPKSDWQTVDRPVDVVILEGWCVGITAEEHSALEVDVNALEQLEDANKLWRKEINRALGGEYKKLYQRLDILVTLQAPSFANVLGWRQLQESKMIEKFQSEGKSTAQCQTPEQIKRFISHYQRLTEHALRTMPEIADYVLWLGQDHRFTKLDVR